MGLCLRPSCCRVRARLERACRRGKSANKRISLNHPARAMESPKHKGKFPSLVSGGIQPPRRLVEEKEVVLLTASALAVTHRTLAPVDLTIIGIYFLIIFGIGFYFSRKERTSEDYFLAGRNVGWFAIGASLFVSNISTEHFIGLAGSGASSGLAVGHFEWLGSAPPRRTSCRWECGRRTGRASSSTTSARCPIVRTTGRQST